MHTAITSKQKSWSVKSRPTLIDKPQRRVRDRVQLVLASSRDYPVVAALFQALHSYNASLDHLFALAENWTGLLREQFDRTCDSPNSLWLLAKKNGQAVGLLIASVHVDSPIFRYNRWVEVEALYVAPAYQGQGIARRLIAQAYTWAGERGSNRVQLYVTATNIRAKNFYALEGFVASQEIQRKFL